MVKKKWEVKGGLTYIQEMGKLIFFISTVTVTTKISFGSRNLELMAC